MEYKLEKKTVFDNEKKKKNYESKLENKKCFWKREKKTKEKKKT